MKDIAIPAANGTVTTQSILPVQGTVQTSVSFSSTFLSAGFNITGPEAPALSVLRSTWGPSPYLQHRHFSWCRLTTSSVGVVCNQRFNFCFSLDVKIVLSSISCLSIICISVSIFSCFLVFWCLTEELSWGNSRMCAQGFHPWTCSQRKRVTLRNCARRNHFH